MTTKEQMLERQLSEAQAEIAELNAIIRMWENGDKYRKLEAELEKQQAEALNWAKIAGQNQAQINKLADEIERLKEEHIEDYVLYKRAEDDANSLRAKLARYEKGVGEKSIYITMGKIGEMVSEPLVVYPVITERALAYQVHIDGHIVYVSIPREL